MLIFALKDEFVWAERNRNGAGQKLMWAERWAGVEKNERSAEREVAEPARNGERILQKQNSQLQPTPLHSNALHRSNRASAEKITTGILYIRLFAQSAVRQYNNRTVLADLLERYSVSLLSDEFLHRYKQSRFQKVWV